MQESKPQAMTAKFSGMILKHDFAPVLGPFRVVLLRNTHNGRTKKWRYEAFLTPTAQKLNVESQDLDAMRDTVDGMFETKLEDWKECEPRKGLPV